MKPKLARFYKANQLSTPPHIRLLYSSHFFCTWNPIITAVWSCINFEHKLFQLRSQVFRNRLRVCVVNPQFLNYANGGLFLQETIQGFREHRIHSSAILTVRRTFFLLCLIRVCPLAKPQGRRITVHCQKALWIFAQHKMDNTKNSVNLVIQGANGKLYIDVNESLCVAVACILWLWICGVVRRDEASRICIRFLWPVPSKNSLIKSCIPLQCQRKNGKSIELFPEFLSNNLD